VGWGYDADGRNTTIDTRTYTFDAAGQMAQMTGQQWVFNHYNNVTQIDGYDGDGARVKETANGVDTYYLRSSVLGGAIIEELASNGAKNAGYVYSPGGQLLAHQANNQVNWQYTTPAGTTKLETFSNSQNSNRVEFDPLGADVGLSGPVAPDTGGGDGDVGANHLGGIMDARWSDFFNISAGCKLDGVATSCGLAMSVVNSGAGVIGPENTTRWNSDPNKGAIGYQFFSAFADGKQGWGAVSGIPGINAPIPRPVMPPTLKPYNDPRHPYRPFDPNFEQRINTSSDYFFVATKTPYVDRDVLDGCTQDYFGVKLNDFDESRIGHSGHFTGTGPSYLPGNKNGYGGTATLTVTNSLRYSNAQLTAINDSLTLPGEPKTGPVEGLTNREAPLTNYTGYDNNAMRMLVVQVHELGHSLDAITQIGYDFPEKHGGKKDFAGKILEDCMRKRGGFKYR